MQLLGKTFLVSGGASGLGKATVQQLVQRGANAVVLDIKDTDAKALVDQIGAKHVLWPGKTDITDEASVQQAIEQGVARFGPLHGAVSCAGVAVASKVLGRRGVHPLDQFLHVQRVNVLGTFNVSRLAAAQMASQEAGPDQERGVLIHTASVAAFDGQNGQVAYAASKGAIASMTLPFAREMGEHGIRVLAIAPGVMDTPMLAGLPEKARALLAKDTVFPHRLGRAEEFGRLVCALCENEYLNGEVVRLDAALRMPRM